MAPKAEKKPAEKAPQGRAAEKLPKAAEKAPAVEKAPAAEKLPKDGPSAAAGDKKTKRNKKSVETYKIDSGFGRNSAELMVIHQIDGILLNLVNKDCAAEFADLQKL